MKNINKIISLLEKVKARPKLYFDYSSPDALLQYLSGFNQGLACVDDSVGYEDLVRDARRTARENAGIGPSSLHPITHWTRQGLSQDEILSNAIDYEIEYWKIRDRSLAETSG